MNNNEKRFTTEQKGTEHKNVIYLFCTSCVLWIQKKAYAESRYLNNNVFFYTIFYEVTYRKLTFFCGMIRILDFNKMQEFLWALLGPVISVKNDNNRHDNI